MCESLKKRRGGGLNHVSLGRSEIEFEKRKGKPWGSHFSSITLGFSEVFYQQNHLQTAGR